MITAAWQLAHIRHGHRGPVGVRVLLTLARLLLPARIPGSPWFVLAIAGVGPLTELLGPRLASGLGRAHPSISAPDTTLPAPLVELTQARALLGTLSRLASERLLALGQRLSPLDGQARPRPEDLAACEALTGECLQAWHDIRRAAARFCAAHSKLEEFLGDHRHGLSPAALAVLRDAVAELLRFFDRVEQHQQLRARRLLLQAGLLVRSAARRGVALSPALHEALTDLAARVADDPAPLPYASTGAWRQDP